MAQDNSITQFFGENLAEILAEKISQIYSKFSSDDYIQFVKKNCKTLSYTGRIDLHADALRQFLPDNYPDAVEILIQILGEENPNETGMFKEFYWIMPAGKFIEKFGLEDFTISIKAIEEITKRNTGEYAIRPYIRKYPQKTIKIMQKWAKSENFHLRRLAAEGCRPKLPWSQKLETFIEQPEPVFVILEKLKEDQIKFVQKSVANNLADYLKVNKDPAIKLLQQWQKSDNKNTRWIIKHATRKFGTI